MKTVFFVHDEQESASARKNFLEMAGFDVKLMRDSREVLAELQTTEPDLVLLDALIHGRNGFEACRELHTKVRGRTFPIILCSRIYRARQFREEAKKAGADEYLLMPMQLDEFLRRITQVLDDFEPGSDGAHLDIVAA